MIPSFEIQDMLPPALAMQDLGPWEHSDRCRAEAHLHQVHVLPPCLPTTTAEDEGLSPAARSSPARWLPPVGKGHLCTQVPAA